MSHHIDWMLNTAAMIAEDLTGDPPRQDFKQIASPVKLSLPPLQPNAHVSITRTAALNALTDALLQFTADGNAAQIALDRYGGASASQDLQWSSLQMAALSDYKPLMAADAVTVGARISDVLDVAASEGVTSVVIDVAQVISMQHVLSTTGFTQAQIADAHAVGLSDAQVFATNSTLLLANPLTQTTVIDVVARHVDLPADWMVNVSPALVTLNPGQVTTVTVSVIPGSPVPQGSIPQVAVEGYSGNTLLGGVAVEVVVPKYVYFDGRLHWYLPITRRP